MVDLEPLFDAPFEDASNLSFELLLASGWILLAGVAFAGRTTATVVLVSLYLLAIPWYVVMRIRVWDGPDDPEDANEADGTDADDGDEDGEDGENRENGKNIEDDINGESSENDGTERNRTTGSNGD